MLAAICMSATAPRQASFNSQGFSCTYSLERGWMHEGGNYVVKEIVGNDQTGLLEVVRQIKKVSDIDDERFRVMLAKHENNARALLQNGQRYLIIDVDFLVMANERCHNKWAAISILAHETGHHISNFEGTPHQAELKADWWSGYILQKLGASERSAIAAMSVIGDEHDSESHPNKYTRIESIKKGYEKAQSE